MTTPSFPSVPKTFNSVVASLKNASTAVLDQFPSFNSLKSTLYRHRNTAAKVPKLQCKSVDEVQVPPDFHDFLLADYTNGDTRIIVFCSEKARKMLSELSDFYADGTFKSCTPPFVQIYTIHGDTGSTEDHTNIIPLVYSLMSNRTTESYKILFSVIKAQIPEWNPINFKTDYEKAAMKAVTEIFPAALMKGCYYHFNKAIWAKGRELSLINDKDIKKQRLVSLSAVLPLLPATEIMNGYTP